MKPQDVVTVSMVLHIKVNFHKVAANISHSGIMHRDTNNLVSQWNGPWTPPFTNLSILRLPTRDTYHSINH